LVANLRNFVQFDYLFCFGSTFLLLGLLFADMKKAGMVKTSWLTLVFSAIATTAIAGPGATIGLGWLWRENVLATKRHKGAILKAAIPKGAINGSINVDANVVAEH